MNSIFIYLNDSRITQSLELFYRKESIAKPSPQKKTIPSNNIPTLN